LKTQRHSWLVGSLFAWSLALNAHPASAQHADSYPERIVRIVVPYSPGGLTDVLARALAQKLSDKWNKPVVIENRPGANGTVGASNVAKAAPDGHSLLIAEGAIYTINPSLYDQLPYDPLKDFAPITMLFSYGHVLVVHPSVPATSLSELIALAKAKPGALAYGSFGSGSSAHLSMESLKTLMGLDLVHVPYKGGDPAIADLLAGRLAVMFVSPTQSAAPIKAGRLRAMGIAVERRSTLLPEVPTFAEVGLPNFEASTWFGMVTSSGTPPAIVDKIHREIVVIIDDPAFKEQWFARRGLDPVGNTPGEFSSYMRAEIPKWAKIIKATGAKAN
jgi:tripartite-type tricarboxylate transporter receptor subunit TctC